MRKQSEILEIMHIFEERDPNPRCELNYTNAFTCCRFAFGTKHR